MLNSSLSDVEEDTCQSSFLLKLERSLAQKSENPDVGKYNKVPFLLIN